MKSKDVEKIIRDALDKEKLVFGYNETRKALIAGNVKAVYVSKTCSDDAKKTLKQLCDLAKVDFIELDMNSKNLGILCRRQHTVATVGVLK